MLACWAENAGEPYFFAPAPARGRKWQRSGTARLNLSKSTCPAQAGRNDQTAPARCSTGLAARVRLNAELTNAICESPCGKLPVSRPVDGSHSSLNKPTSLHLASNRLN